MASVEAPGRPADARGRRVYLKAPRPIEFPSEEPPEEHVSETKRHLEARTTLYLLLKDAIADAAIGSDQFVYSDAGDPRRCLSPDAFVKLGAREGLFDSWKIWERGAPDLAVEIVSASDHSEAEWTVKLERYQASGIREVVRFDPDAKQPLRIWDRVADVLLERSPEGKDLRECVSLGLWWVVLPSEYGPMLRLARDRDGVDVLPTPSEGYRRRTEELAEERKARTIAEHERMLEQHARVLAEQERAREQQARTLAEEKQALAEEKRVLAEDALGEARAEIERLRADLARARGSG